MADQDLTAREDRFIGICLAADRNGFRFHLVYLITDEKPTTDRSLRNRIGVRHAVIYVDAEKPFSV
jgi:hypothetical protein